MPSQKLYFRLDEDTYRILLSQSRDGESLPKTAQRIMTLALTGKEPDPIPKGRPFGAKKKEPLPTLEERVKILEDYILGDGK